MRQRLGLRLFLSSFVVALTVYNAGAFFFAASLPVGLTFQDASTARISPLAGIPLPAGLRDGDLLDLASLDAPARSGMVLYVVGRTLPLDRTYQLAVRRDGGIVRVPVTTIRHSPTLEWRWVESVTVFSSLLLGALSLLLLWFGRDRAALGMAIWCLGYVFGPFFDAIHLDGTVGVASIWLSNLCFIAARVGFYIMAESLVGSAFSARARFAFRGGFVLLIILGALQTVVGPIQLAVTGSAEFLLPRYSYLFSWIYALPIAMMFVGSRQVGAAQRLRLRWVMWGGLGIMLAVTFLNATPFGFVTSVSVSYSLFALGACAILYSLLRHRVVDFNVVVDRALVYGGVTTLVVGIIAAVNSLALRATLGDGAGLLLQIVVPLALGIVLGKLRIYMDLLVERVFFRRKYQAEQALKTFARRCGHMEDAPKLLEAAVKEVQKHTASPAVAIYAEADLGYVRVSQSRGAHHAARLEADDPAMVAARAEHEALALAGLESALGADGYVFPMTVLGVLRGVLVCANRPGERYASDERKLLMQVATDVAAAWRILRARENEEFVRAVARGDIKLSSVKTRAKALEQSWLGA